MTDDFKELEVSFRDGICGSKCRDMSAPFCYCSKAADAIATLCKERDEARDETDVAENCVCELTFACNDLDLKLEIAIRERDEAREINAEVYQAVGALTSMTGLFDEPDVIRILDVLAYGKTIDGIELLPWPKSQELLDRLEKAMAEIPPAALPPEAKS